MANQHNGLKQVRHLGNYFGSRRVILETGNKVVYKLASIASLVPVTYCWKKNYPQVTQLCTNASTLVNQST